MKLEKTQNILIVGLGLIGGSYAKSLKSQGYRVSAVTKNPKDIEYALNEGMIDEGRVTPDRAFLSKFSLIVFALYPHTFIEWINDYGALIKRGTVLTDVTGVKGCITNKIQSIIPRDVEFIAAHPMAGREVCGVRNSDPEIFKEANYIVVPTDKNTESSVSLCKSLGETLGFADISVLTATAHDEMIAFLSQLTHCIAISLMCANNNPDLVHFTGDSFRDLTRIANINDEMWSELFLANKPALLKEMDAFKEAFERLYGYIKNDDRESMRTMMKLSTSRRRLFEKRKNI